MDRENSYFDIQADMGISKHIGGRIATRKLVRLAHIKAGDHILEIGCGVGRTACFLAKAYQVKVTSIDISSKMIQRAQKRAKKEGVEDRVEFIRADAQKLPFSENCFDALIDESVSAFVPDQPKAFKEYLRVLKEGAYLAINEVTWKEMQDEGMVDYIKKVMGGPQFHEMVGWRTLLTNAGFKKVQAEEHSFKIWEQFIGEIQQFNLFEYIYALSRLLTQMFINPKYRRFVRDVFSKPLYLFTFTKKIKQGFYSGQKL